ncbi:deoxyribose-phosphate aldolase, partial [Merismopedia glauca]
MDTNAENIDLAPFIDHALLNPTATSEQLAKCCEQAERFRFATVCIYPTHVRQAVELLHGKQTKVCSVIGFPTGATTSATKLYEAQEAAENGAKELDVVINLGWVKLGQTDDIYRELAGICSGIGLVTKVIIETNLLTDAEKQLAVEICLDAGATFIKTCTGWFGGVSLADVKLIKEVAKDRIGIKASGGISTRE